MGFELGARSRKALEGVHPDLIKVVERAIELSEIDFKVTEGVRTLARQRELVAAGASTTLKSRHLPGKDGVCFAVDLGALVGGKIRWDWPLYSKLAVAMKQASIEVGVPIEWGGGWKTFKDGPHFQLPNKQYPA